jgi:hypothetical protein
VHRSALRGTQLLARRALPICSAPEEQELVGCLGVCEETCERRRVRRLDAGPRERRHIEAPELRGRPARARVNRSIQRSLQQEQRSTRRVVDHRDLHVIVERHPARWMLCRCGLRPGVGGDVVEPGVGVHEIRVRRRRIVGPDPSGRARSSEDHDLAVDRIGGDGIALAFDQRSRQRAKRDRIGPRVVKAELITGDVDERIRALLVGDLSVRRWREHWRQHARVFPPILLAVVEPRPARIAADDPRVVGGWPALRHRPMAGGAMHRHHLAQRVGISHFGDANTRRPAWRVR